MKFLGDAVELEDACRDRLRVCGGDLLWFVRYGSSRALGRRDTVGMLFAGSLAAAA